MSAQMNVFKELARKEGWHPKLIVNCPKLLKQHLKKKPEAFTDEFLKQAARETLPYAQEWAKENNKKKKRTFFANIVDTQWLTYGDPEEPPAYSLESSIPYPPPPKEKPVVKEANVSTIPIKQITKGSGRKRFWIWNYPATRILRWMGKQNWTMAQMSLAVQKLGLEIEPQTMKCQRNSGVNDDGVPDLTTSQTQLLNQLIEEKQTCKTTKKPASKSTRVSISSKKSSTVSKKKR